MKLCMVQGGFCGPEGSWRNRADGLKVAMGLVSWMAPPPGINSLYSLCFQTLTQVSFEGTVLWQKAGGSILQVSKQKD